MIMYGGAGVTASTSSEGAYTMTATKHVPDGHKVDYDGQSMTATSITPQRRHKEDHDRIFNDGHKLFLHDRLKR